MKGGANFSRVGDPLGSHHGPRTGRSADGVGYHIGIGRQFDLPGIWGVRSELLFSSSTTGYYAASNVFDPRRSSTSQGGVSGTRSMRAQGLELPVLLTLHRWSGLRVEAGPATSILLKATERWKADEAPDGSSETYGLDRTGDLRTLEWAIVLGMEVEGAKGFGALVRLWKGLSNLDVAQGASPSYITTWQVGVSYGSRGSSR